MDKAQVRDAFFADVLILRTPYLAGAILPEDPRTVTSRATPHVCTGKLVPELATLIRDDVVLDARVVGLLHGPHAEGVLPQEPRIRRVRP